MASSMSFSISQRRISLSPEAAAPVNSGDPLNTMASREPLPSRLNLDIMCWRNSSDPSLTRGSPAPNRPAMPNLSCSSSISFCTFFHSTPKGGLERK